MNTRPFKLAAIPVAALFFSALLAACGGASDRSEFHLEAGPLRVSAGGIGQFRKPGGDNSIEEYGREGTRPELEQAAATVHAYLVARMEGDWLGACSYVSRDMRQHLKRILAFSGLPANRSCARSMRTIASGEPPIAKTLYEATEVDAGSLRAKGNFGFLFFNAHTNGHKLLIRREGGSWKVNGLLPTPLH